jgi:hypothetical protein
MRQRVKKIEKRGLKSVKGNWEKRLKKETLILPHSFYFMQASAVRLRRIQISVPFRVWVLCSRKKGRVTWSAGREEEPELSGTQLYIVRSNSIVLSRTLTSIPPRKLGFYMGNPTGRNGLSKICNFLNSWFSMS